MKIIRVWSFIVTSFLLFLTNAMGFEAEFKKGLDLYARRGENYSFALDAAKHFESMLPNLGPQDYFKASKVLREIASSYYFYAESLPSNSKNDKIKLHIMAYDAAELGAKNLHHSLGKPKFNDADSLHLLADLYYWYGANLGKWGENNGVVASLKKWPTLKAYMQAIIDMGQATVNGYGANRILGRALFKIPKLMGGDAAESQRLLAECHDMTIDTSKPYGISSYSTNVMFYAQTLHGNGHKQHAIDLLTKLVNIVGASQASIIDYNPQRVPETIVDIELAQKLLSMWTKKR